MFNDKPVLIVEENAFVALDLSAAIEELDGRVIGPATSVAEAFELVDRQDLAGAIVDCHLADGDIAALADLLAERRVSFVIHSCTDPPEAISLRHPDVPVLRKPLQPRAVIACLLEEMKRAVDTPTA